MDPYYMDFLSVLPILVEELQAIISVHRARTIWPTVRLGELFVLLRSRNGATMDVGYA